MSEICANKIRVLFVFLLCICLGEKTDKFILTFQRNFKAQEQRSLEVGGFKNTLQRREAPAKLILCGLGEKTETLGETLRLTCLSLPLPPGLNPSSLVSSLPMTCCPHSPPLPAGFL